MKKIFILIITCLSLFSCSATNQGEIKVPGLIDAEIITLKSLVPGTIEEIHCKEGDKVEKGQLLVEIDTKKIKNQLLELKIKFNTLMINQDKVNKKLAFVNENLNYLQKQVKRYQRLKANQSIAGDTLETMKLKLLEAQTSWYELLKTLELLEMQKNELANKEEYLELLTREHRLLAPINGFILEKFVSPGENIFPGTPMADILDLSSFYIEAFVEHREMSTLRLGQKVHIMVDGHTGKELAGTITHFGRKAEFSPKYIVSEKERQSLLYQVKITPLDNLDVYKVGMQVTVSISVKTKRPS